MSDLMEHGTSREMRSLIAEYAERGWLDANMTVSWTESEWGRPARPAYLRISSVWPVFPSGSVQITARCYQTFLCTRLIAVSQRFDLGDLKIEQRSQFRRAENLSLRACVGEVAHELIQWPLEGCPAGGDVIVCAILPASEALRDDDTGEVFEMLLLGEVL